MWKRRHVHPVIELELALLSPAVRRSKARLEALLHADFREVGASGRLWTRDEIIALLTAEEADDDEPIEAVEVDVRGITPEVVLVTFVTDPGGRAARRSSLWRLEGGRWRMLHHQGTLLPVPG